MANLEFKDFFNSCYQNIADKQGKRISENFDGNFSMQDLTAQIINEINVSIFDYLENYHNWLFNNFEISPKKK